MQLPGELIAGGLARPSHPFEVAGAGCALRIAARPVRRLCYAAAMFALRALSALVALAGAAAALAAPAAAPLDLPATFRLQGRGHVEARPLAPWDGELRADAVITRGERAGELLLHLSAEGIACDLAARLDAAGALTLTPRQRCASAVRNAALDGRVEAVLTSGAGRIVGEALELEVTFTVTGAVRLQEGDLLGALVPGAGDPVPIRGEGHARANGRRDRSRAAGGD